jgi:hypothetical protein
MDSRNAEDKISPTGRSELLGERGRSRRQKKEVVKEAGSKWNTGSCIVRGSYIVRGSCIVRGKNLNSGLFSRFHSLLFTAVSGKTRACINKLKLKMRSLTEDAPWPSFEAAPALEILATGGGGGLDI